MANMHQRSSQENIQVERTGNNISPSEMMKGVVIDQQGSNVWADRGMMGDERRYLGAEHGNQQTHEVMPQPTYTHPAIQGNSENRQSYHEGLETMVTSDGRDKPPDIRSNSMEVDDDSRPRYKDGRLGVLNPSTSLYRRLRISVA